jgi:hypothetical protein
MNWTRGAPSGGECAGQGDVPSFVHAAVKGVRMAKRPREIAESFMMALSHAREAFCVRSAQDEVSLSGEPEIRKRHVWRAGSGRFETRLPRPAVLGVQGCHSECNARTLTYLAEFQVTHKRVFCPAWALHPCSLFRDSTSVGVFEAKEDLITPRSSLHYYSHGERVYE